MRYDAEAVVRWPLNAAGAAVLTARTGCYYLAPAQRGGLWSPYDGLDEAQATELRGQAEAIRRRGTVDAHGHFVAAAEDAAALAADSRLRSLIGSLTSTPWSPYDGLDEAQATELRGQADAIMQRGTVDAHGQFVAAAEDAAALAADSRLRSLTGSLWSPFDGLDEAQATELRGQAEAILLRGSVDTHGHFIPAAEDAAALAANSHLRHLVASRRGKWTPAMDVKLREVRSAHPTFTWPQTAAAFVEVMGDDLANFDGKLDGAAVWARYRTITSKPSDADGVNKLGDTRSGTSILCRDECLLRPGGLQDATEDHLRTHRRGPSLPRFQSRCAAEAEVAAVPSSKQRCELKNCPAGAGNNLGKKPMPRKAGKKLEEK